VKVEVIKDSAVEKRVEIEIPAERVDDEIEELYQEVQRQAHVKGFRPGKTPRRVLERLFKDYVREQVMQKLVKESLEPALSRKGIEPVAEPVIDPSEVEPGKPYNYTVHVEVHPQIEVNDYKGIEFAHKKESAKEEDVDRTIESLRESVATIREPEEDRPIKEDDQVTAELVVKHEGEELDLGGQEEHVIELWKDSWIPDLKKHLVGAALGREVSFIETAPDNENVPEQFRGKKLEFHIKIKGIKERVLPELDDEFAKSFTRSESMEELRSSIRESLEKRVEEQNRTAMHSALLEELIRRNPIEVPNSLVERESLAMAKNFVGRAAGREPSDEEARQFAAMFREDAKKSLQADYLLEAVARQEGIEASDEEVDKRIEDQAKAMNMHPDKLKGRLGEAGREMVKRRVATDKALDFLEGQANMIKEAGEPEQPKKA